MARRSLEKQAHALLVEMTELDDALYKTVTRRPTPVLELPLRRLSSAGNHSRLWLTLAGGLAVFGGPSGRRAAGLGVLSLLATSAIVRSWPNPTRRRPRRAGAAAVLGWSRRAAARPAAAVAPRHSAPGFAFASAVGRELPGLRRPLAALATAVAYSRVHTGAQPPRFALAEAAAGATIGQVVARGFDWAQASA